MTWKSLVPFAGKRSVSSKLRDIESKAPTLPIIFAAMVMKVFESLVVGKTKLVLAFGGAAILSALAHIYRLEAKKAIAEGAEKAEEMIDNEE